MTRILFLIFVLAITFCSNIQAQNKSSSRIRQLEDTIMRYNDELEFEKSMEVLSQFIIHNSLTPYEKYQAYLLKSYTYKRLFNYEEALYNLDMALEAGKNSTIPQIENTIKAEKALIYFDIQNYAVSKQLTSELEKSDYKYIPCNTKSFLIMQLGYLQMLDKQYAAAEETLDLSLSTMADCSPRDLPNIYGKKIELYNNMKEYAKRNESFERGLEIADHYNVIKYKLYLYEIMRNMYSDNKEFEKMQYAQQKFDSLNFIYDAQNNNGRLHIMEKKNEAIKAEKERNQQKKFSFFLMALLCLVGAALIVIILLYKSINHKKKTAEKENERINNEVQRLTQTANKDNATKFNLNDYDFTDRQKSIIQLLQDGRTNKEIANTLYISENTVKYHLKIIYDTLSIKNRSELTRMSYIKDPGNENSEDPSA